MYAAVCAIAVTAALAVILWDRWQARRTMKALDRMLDEAMAGTFLEKRYDETMLSSVEARLAHYLAANAVSAQEIQEEKERVKTLLADISHQTKTPIANVRLYAQLLEEQALPQEGRLCAAALSEQAEKLQTLIDVLVKTSRLEAGVLCLHPKAGPVAAVLESAAAQLARKAEDKGVTLTLVPTEAAAVFDPKWTEEAVCNLLDNAVKYTPAGGSISVQVFAYEYFCRVNITDSGPGIPEEERAKIFQRFYRAPNARESEGVGIGLYLTRQIAEGQGGYVKVFSKPGRGSTFALFLPR